MRRADTDAEDRRPNQSENPINVALMTCKRKQARKKTRENDKDQTKKKKRKRKSTDIDRLKKGKRKWQQPRCYTISLKKIRSETKMYICGVEEKCNNRIPRNVKKLKNQDLTTGK